MKENNCYLCDLINSIFIPIKFVLINIEKDYNICYTRTNIFYNF